MKKNISYLLAQLVLLVFTQNIWGQKHVLRAQSPLVIPASIKQQIEPVIAIFDTFEIPYTYASSIDASDANHLYLICDAHTIHKKDLPKYYVVYQTLNLSINPITQDYLDILANAVAIWDYDNTNINHYRHLNNYYYFPANYEYADPVVLPCFLPIHMLDAYKQMLVYSNQRDTDISSHIPALFTYAALLNPKLIVEAGVRGGQSTKPFYKAMDFCNATMIGLDIESSYAAAYNALTNSLFVHMNDLDFADYYKKSSYHNTPIDLIFIDTSHEYEHTLAEIKMFVPLLNDNGILAFHDSNVTPLAQSTFVRINGTYDSAPGNTRGVTQALKECFSLEFNEYAYVNTIFINNGTKWHMIHYPFCNGLTVIQKIN